ncbi:hypothetical protein D918_09826 [Trichuris suis]|nr:hypothetical protein D918_09826 [Trichuris suis]
MYRVLKEVHCDTGMSSKAMSFMGSFMNDLVSRQATQQRRKNADTTLVLLISASVSESQSE